MIGGVAFFDGDECAAAGSASFVVNDELGLDGGAVFAGIDHAGA